MPNTKSAIRRVRRVKNSVNRIRKVIQNAVKNMEQLLKNKDKEKAKKFFQFQSI